MSKIRIAGYKAYWSIKEDNGGIALLLSDTKDGEAQIPVNNPTELAALAQFFGTFKEIFFDEENQVVFTNLFTPGTTKD